LFIKIHYLKLKLAVLRNFESGTFSHSVTSPCGRIYPEANHFIILAGGGSVKNILGRFTTGGRSWIIAADSGGLDFCNHTSLLGWITSFFMLLMFASYRFYVSPLIHGSRQHEPAT